MNSSNSTIDDEPSGSTNLRQWLGLGLGPLLFVVLFALPPPSDLSIAAWRTAALGVLMAVWWISEAIPIPATALLPLVLVPVLGILPIAETAAPYANPVIFLFMGGFIIAIALQGCGLHRRLALAIITVFGTSPPRLVGGFMVATAFISMWVSNTATVVMLLPVALSVIEVVEQERRRPVRQSNFAITMLLGLAYAANIGGIGTLIGTPPNALLAGFVSEVYGIEIGFAEWMLFGVPLVVLAIPLCWILLVRVFFPVVVEDRGAGEDFLRDERNRLGGLSSAELVVGSITLVVATCWIFQPLISSVLPGLSDAGIAIAGALLLFIVPVDLRPVRVAVDWEAAEQLPWSVLILFGGGLSLASAIQKTGLAEWIGASLGSLGAIPLVALVVVVTTVIVFLTELTSNTATAAAFLPVVASLAVGFGAGPLDLAIPTAVGASCAFMMPVATPPNALVYGSGHITIPMMAKVGFWLNWIMIALTTVLVFAIARNLFA